MKKLFAVLLLLGLFCLMASFDAQAQFRNPTTVTGDLSPNMVVVTNGTARTLTYYAYPTANGASFAPYFVSTNAGTANLTFWFYQSVDGVNFLPTAVQTNTVALNGTTAVRSKIDIPAASIPNASAIQVVVSNSHTAPIYFSNMVYSTWR